MVLSTKRCSPPLPEAYKLKPAHAKSFYDWLFEDAIKQEQDVTHLKCIRVAVNHIQLKCKSH